MRTTQLARVAAQAEKLRLQRIAWRLALRAGCAVVAAVFALAALIALHVWVAIVLARNLGPATACAIVLGIDLVFAVVLGVLALRSPPDPLAEEAKIVRDRALAQIKESVAVAALLGPLARILGKRHVYGMTLAALTFRFLFGRK